MRLAIAVSPGTDILNPLPGGRGQTFMPSERMTAGDKEWTASNTQFEGGMGIDATVPYGYEQEFHRPVYPVDRVKLEDLFTEADIQNVHKRIAQWKSTCLTSRGSEVQVLLRPLYRALGEGASIGGVRRRTGRVLR